MSVVTIDGEGQYATCEHGISSRVENIEETKEY
jgi:hypothetical protein